MSEVPLQSNPIPETTDGSDLAIIPEMEAGGDDDLPYTLNTKL
jgi:hypothetical protein